MLCTPGNTEEEICAPLEAGGIGSGEVLLLPAQLSFQSSSLVLSLLSRQYCQDLRPLDQGARALVTLVILF